MTGDRFLRETEAGHIDVCRSLADHDQLCFLRDLSAVNLLSNALALWPEFRKIRPKIVRRFLNEITKKELSTNQKVNHFNKIPTMRQVESLSQLIESNTY